MSLAAISTCWMAVDLQKKQRRCDLMRVVILCFDDVRNVYMWIDSCS